MSLYFRRNGAAIRLIEDEGVITSPALHYRQGNRTHHIPLIPPDGACYNAAQTVRYAYSASADRTLHVIYHGRRYVVPNTITPLIDIPAGTYAGYTAYGIFKNFISPNAYRVLKNKVTVSHRGIAKTFDAGTAVWLTHAYGGETINLTFTQQRSAMPRAEPGYNGNKEWWTDSARNAPTIQLHIRASHWWSGITFTISHGVKFL